MRVLSATEAIEPAWDHARRMTFAPRSWRLALKLTAVGFFARMGGCHGNFNSPGKNAMHGAHLPAAMHAAIFGMFLLIGLVAFVIGLVLFYVGSRLEFVFFDSVLRSDSTIAPIWRRYGRATWYWIGLKIAYFVVVMLCMLPFLIPMVVQIIHLVKSGNHQTPAMISVLMTFLGSLAIVVILALFAGVGYALLADFGLPSMALEGTPLGVTVRRVFGLLFAEPGQVVLFLLLKFVMGIAASIVCVIAIVLGTLLALIPFGGAGAVVWAILHHAGVMGHVLMVALIATLGLVYGVLVFLACIMLFGYVQLFFQAYALYFLGGRYPLVGAYLEPYVPQPYGYPPPGFEPPVAPLQS
jgi:hypothetical protein